MSGHGAADTGRRLRLRVAIKLLLGVGVGGICYILLAAFLSADRSPGAFKTKRVELAGMQPGDTRHLTWDGRPVLIHRRTTEEIAALAQSVLPLADPESRAAVQPVWAASDRRSRDPEWFVAIALGTDFSCPVRYLPPDNGKFMQRPWSGGYVDECRGSRYDSAGRVFAEQYAERNLMVPDYHLQGETLILGSQAR